MIGCLITLQLTAQEQPLPNGEYLIKINDTGRYLAIAGGSDANGAWLIQWDKEYSAHFRFQLTHLGNHVYTLQAKHSGKFISTADLPQAGVKLVQWNWLNQDNQKWYIKKQPGSRGYVMSCYQNLQRVVVRHFNSRVTPANGDYTFLQSDAYARSMTLDFKKNEAL